MPSETNEQLQNSERDDKNGFFGGIDSNNFALEANGEVARKSTRQDGRASVRDENRLRHVKVSLMEYGMGKCACCSAEQANPRIKLWDGKYYCVPCLDGAAERLADYAEANAVFEETMPESVNRQLPTVVKIVFRDRLLKFAALAGLCTMWIFSWPPTLTTVAVLIAVAIFEACFAAFYVWARGPFRRRRFARGVRIENGIISVLKDGRVKEQFSLDSARCLRAAEPIECIFLVDTTGKESFRQVFKRIALAGFTDHTRRLIEGLLKIKGIELQSPTLGNGT